MSQHRDDVVIVGAGPTGLLLAGDLAEAGCAVTVLEKRDGESNLTRAFAVHARTLETLDARGLADELIATGHREGRLRLFGGADLRVETIDSRFPFVLITPQYHTERLLRRRALDAGAKILTGRTVTDVGQDDSGVTVIARTPEGTEVEHRSSYLVGTDGVRSTVREALGLPFPGRLAIGSMVLADVAFDDPPRETVTVNGTSAGFVFIAPFGDGYHRVIYRTFGDTRPEDAPVEPEEIRRLLLAVFGRDFGMADVRWTSRFHSDERQVPRYRVGRVFLAGDAAHVHSPAGGQGMNAGLLDAANLSWKLAAAVHGWAVPGLLDSYSAERHPIGKDVLRASGMILRVGLLRSAIARSVRNAVVGTMLRLPPVMGRATRLVSGVGVRLPVPSGVGSAVGRRAPDVLVRPESADGATRLYEVLRAGKFVYIASSHGEVPPELVEHVVSVRPQGSDGWALLVRPDGYIAWAGKDKETPVWIGGFLAPTS
ncbi:FAD-dependent monooxygenase [Stackebrandtia soli]|uniref:FAD-dependent monooxygenase n=1 Tax=Stackebrandtia soli TaxID=1892856 RepID=UPI0039E8EA25